MDLLAVRFLCFDGLLHGFKSPHGLLLHGNLFGCVCRRGSDLVDHTGGPKRNSCFKESFPAVTKILAVRGEGGAGVIRATTAGVWPIDDLECVSYQAVVGRRRLFTFVTVCAVFVLLAPTSS